MNPMGGSEIAYYTVDKFLKPGWKDKINLMLSTCRWEWLDSTKKNIVWQQLNTNEDNVKLMGDPDFVDKVDYFVWVSYWQYEKFRQLFNVPAYKSVIIRNAVPPTLFHPRENNGKIKLVYTSTPWRGLDVLVNAVRILNRPDIELDIYSSTKIYGPAFEKQTEGQFDWIYDLANNTPGVTLHGYAPNDVVRDTVSKAHIFAYPNTFEETSCISALEAMVSGCLMVTTGYGVLPETCGGFASYIPYGPNRDVLASRYASALNTAINKYWSPETQDLLQRQHRFYNDYHTWPVRIQEWQEFFDNVMKE